VRGRVSIRWVVSAMAILAGCGAGDGEELPETLTHDEQSICDSRGSVHFHLDDLPRQVVVAEGVAFGTSGRITGVAEAPGTERIAFTTAGVAHGFGWILGTDGEEEAELAVFQYGGTVELVGWDDSGRFAAFQVDTPAGSSELRITDAASRGAFPEDRTSPVALQEAEGLPPRGVSIAIQRGRAMSFASPLVGSGSASFPRVATDAQTSPREIVGS
jgi:hypothetical protein